MPIRMSDFEALSRTPPPARRLAQSSTVITSGCALPLFSMTSLPALLGVRHEGARGHEARVGHGAGADSEVSGGLMQPRPKGGKADDRPSQP